MTLYRSDTSHAVKFGIVALVAALIIGGGIYLFQSRDRV